MSTFHILQCANPNCRMRFPAPARTVLPACPRCGSPLLSEAVPFETPRVEAGEVVTPSGPELDIVLDNLRSAFNVGSILRTADGAGVHHAYLCGISSTPDNPKVAKTALSAEFSTPWTYSPNGPELVANLKRRGMEIWALEGGNNAVAINELLPSLPDRLVLVAGNELAGVDPAILVQCDRVVFLPMQGFKSSLNVAVAFGIAIYMLRFAGHTA